MLEFCSILFCSSTIIMMSLVISSAQYSSSLMHSLKMSLIRILILASQLCSLSHLFFLSIPLHFLCIPLSSTLQCYPPNFNTAISTFHIMSFYVLFFLLMLSFLCPIFPRYFIFFMSFSSSLFHLFYVHFSLLISSFQLAVVVIKQ